MKCRNCGTEIPNSTNACPKCGKRYTPGKYCPYCKTVIPATATVCRKCGRIQPGVQQPQSPINQQPAPSFVPRKKKTRWYHVVLIVIGVLFLTGMVNGFIQGLTTSENKTSSSSSGQKQTQKPKNSEPEATAPPASSEQQVEAARDKSEYIHTDFDTSGYLFVSADLLYEYGEYFVGEKVCTVITVEDKDRTLLKASTTNNDSFFYSVNCEFSTEGLTEAFEEGETLSVAGTVDEKALIGSTVTLKNCSILGIGESGFDFSNSKEICEQQKATYEAQQMAEKAASRDEYKYQCITVDYSDVERNPDNYKGKKIMVSGSVEQVQEGWLDTVALRLNCNGNMWYVTYMREEGESRILEGDYISCYGECDGVTSYTTVLGSQVTIPSLSMKYYE